jgi:hypothetical protein
MMAIEEHGDDTKHPKTPILRKMLEKEGEKVSLNESVPQGHHKK